jgi:hypothetical protein
MLNDVNVAPFPVPIIQVQRAANIVTVTTSGPHGLIAPSYGPDQTIISNVPASGTSFNSTFTIASVLSSTQFTFAQTGVNETQLGGFSSGVGLGAVFTDPVLIPYVNSAYRRVRRNLAMSGMPLFIIDDVYMVLPAVSVIDPSLTVGITDSTSPQLPVDLLEPEVLWERPNLSNNDFIEMTDLTEHGGLPSLPQGSTLGMWEWRTDGLYFLGATLDTQLRLRYKRTLTDVTDGTSPILIRDSVDCITYLAAAMAAMSRGSPMAEKWATAGEDGIEALIAAATRREQQTVRRRRPNSSRTGGFWSGWNWGGRASW